MISAIDLFAGPGGWSTGASMAWVKDTEMGDVMRKAVFLYDYTGLMAKPWIDAGYECWCFDGQHEPGIVRDGLHVKVGMWFFPDGLRYQAATIKALVGDGVVMVFGFPECTHLAVSGAAHFQKKLDSDPMIQVKAAELAKLVEVVGNEFGCAWAA